ECFGISWPEALKQDLVCNASEAEERLGWTSQQLGTHWDTLEMGIGKVKFGGGFYCGQLHGLFVINGFYMAMRQQYVVPGSSVFWFNVKWPTNGENGGKLSWKRFREEVVGNTDPGTAKPVSLRGYFYKHWDALGLPGQPHVGENAVHGSASPFEALVEKMNWLDADYGSDPFGSLLSSQGVSEATVNRWRLNPVVKVDGRNTSLFDLVENLDTIACLKKAKCVFKEQQQQQQQQQQKKSQNHLPVNEIRYLLSTATKP
ncbi:unnamed protein product, partial [Symbiodinium pilosum]